MRFFLKSRRRPLTRSLVRFEQLEDRRMLEGTFATAIIVDVSSGRGSAPGAINPSVASTDNDYYRFTSPISGFVSVLSDTSNEAVVSVLDTKVEVFRSNFQRIGLGNNNGSLSSGLAGDGWVGFIAEAGQDYYVRVSAETGMGAGTPGTYTVRINGINALFSIGGETPADTGIARELNSPIPAPPFIPITPILGQLGGVSLPVSTRLRQDEIIYRYDVPAGTQWDSLITIDAMVTRPGTADPLTTTRLDTRLDVYNAAGLVVAADSTAGRLNDAFTTVRANPGDTFYIRVRSDEIRSANPQVATGPFFLVLDAIATQLTLNPVTRRGGDPGGAFDAFGSPTDTPNPVSPNPVFQTKSYEFIAQGDGLTIITAIPRGIFSPVRDPAITLYDNTGRFVTANDNFAGTSAQVEARLIGGQKYFLVIDGFEVNSLTDFSLFIESNHTFLPNPDPTDVVNSLDDHVDTFVLPQTPTQADRDTQRRQFELATGLVFGPAFETLDGNRNLVRDRGLRTVAQGTGRIHTAGDRDLFQFIPQVDMLTNHGGNNDDSGTSLFVGGVFDNADPNNPRPTESRNLSIFDAADWWYTGAQYFDPAFNVTYGFNDNADTLGTDGAEVYAINGEDDDSYYRHINALCDKAPQITMDDGCDLVTVLHTKMTKYLRDVFAGTEETSTGVTRLRAMAKDKKLKFPVIAINDADTKHLFDNRYGTGQSTIDAIIRATDPLIAGKVVVVVGYGWCGRGVASRAAGHGAQVIVTEVDPLKALEAAMDGYRVMPMAKAAREGDIFVSVTGNMHTIAEKHFPLLKDGAIVSNAGHFDIEIDVKGLARLAKKVNKNLRHCVDEYILASGKRIYLLAEGRLVNLAAAEGHPASVMDMSFATQALAAEWAWKSALKGKFDVRVHAVPRKIEEDVATLKLAAMGIAIDKLTPEQKKYLSSWEFGTA